MAAVGVIPAKAPVPIAQQEIHPKILTALTQINTFYQANLKEGFLPGHAAIEKVVSDAFSSGLKSFFQTALFESPKRDRECSPVTGALFSRIEYLEAWFSSAAQTTVNFWITVAAVVNYVVHVVFVQVGFTAEVDKQKQLGRAKEILFTQCIKFGASFVGAKLSMLGVLAGPKMDQWLKNVLITTYKHSEESATIIAEILLNLKNEQARPTEFETDAAYCKAQLETETSTGDVDTEGREL